MTATQGFLLLPIRWYHRIDQRGITEGYRGYMEFHIAFVSWVWVLLDFLKLSNFFSLYLLFLRRKLFLLFQTMKNDWVWRKTFEKFITILNVLVDNVTVLFFQVASIIKKLDNNKFGSFFTEELKILNNNLTQYVYLFILIYPLQYAKRLLT